MTHCFTKSTNQRINIKIICSFFIIFATLILTISCNSGQNTETVKQMVVQVANNETHLDVINEWKIVGQTLVVLSISETSTLNCLFNAEAIGAKRKVGSDWLEPFEVRILVDDEVASPSSASFPPSVLPAIYFSSHSFLATMRNVSSGSHTITVEWRQTIDQPLEKNARMRNRTLTVWQTVSQ